MKLDKQTIKQEIINNIKEFTGKSLADANPRECYYAVCKAVLPYITDAWQQTKDIAFETQAKHAYYFSAEFLMGRAFGNNIINFGLKNEVMDVLDEIGIEFNLIEDQECDAGLGNGGLGRLAACFLDSLATLRYPSVGYGIRYRYGMFEQKIENGFQVEKPDNWLQYGDAWEMRKEPQHVYVKFGGHVDNIIENTGRVGFRRNHAETIIAIPYDMPIVGYNNGHINTLRLWQAQAVEPFNLQAFNNGDYEIAVAAQNSAENISRVLYPNDNSPRGKELRLRQQYFFCSASLQDIVNHYTDQYGENKWDNFADKVAIQLNDTHPVVSIPELMRILMDWKGLEWDQSWDIVQKVFAYTNHTVLAEALESWDIAMFRALLPRIYQIIEEINRRFMNELRSKFPDNWEYQESFSILSHGRIHMAHLAIVGSYKVNGVAALHTEILKNDVLKNWYELYPEKFLNKTNGITPRRWMLKANPALCDFIDSKIGKDWHTDLDKLKEFEKFSSPEVLDKLIKIKQDNKNILVNLVKKQTGIDLDPTSIFDVQVKRLHEYKRQLLNALHIISLYLRLKENPNLDIHPRSFIFAGKAASGYWRAKSIIKLINNIAEVINNDPVISKKIKVVFIPNYNVSIAERIFPASDISEQISTAGKEASGTGNMKFMANGAITLGTLDGANVEILEEVGADNCIIFGSTADEISQANNECYTPASFFNQNSHLAQVLQSLVNGTFTLGEDSELFRIIYDSLVYGVDGQRADVYYLLKDFDSYCEAQKQIDILYRDRKKWAKMMLKNISHCGKFSSDRTITEYANEIWNIKPLSQS